MGFLAAALPAAAGAGGTLSAISTGLSVFGAIQGFVGQRNAGQAAAGASKYNAAVAANNAIIAKRNAQLAGQEGAAATEAAQFETRAKVGAIKAQQAASGVDINSGSSVDVRSSAAETGQLSALNIRAAAARKVYGYQNQASDYESQSGLYTAQAKNDLAAGNMNATTTLLGGLSSAGMDYAKYLENRSPVSVN